MIDNQAQLQSVIDYCKQDLDYSNMRFSNEMKSAVANFIFTDIENNINELYQKIRLLEDVKNYTKEFVVRSVQEKRTQLIEMLKTIEMLSDKVSNNKNTVLFVTHSDDTLYDRNGEELPLLEVKDDVYVMPGTVSFTDAVINIVNKGPVLDTKVKQTVSEEESYSSINYEAILNPDLFAEGQLLEGDGLQHLDIWHNDEPVTGSLRVNYEINFAGKTKSNYLDFKLVDCKIISATLTDIDGVNIEFDPVKRYFEPSRLGKADITVQCYDYQPFVLQVPIDKHDDAFDLSITGDEIYG